MKKGIGLSFNALAIAVIAFFVLVVLIMIFNDSVNVTAPFLRSQAECEGGQGGTCMDSADPCEDGSKVFGLGCKEPSAYCCIKR